MRTPGRVLLGAACVWSLVLCGPATSAVLPSGFTESLVAGGLTNPTAMEFAPDGRLFVCLQGGQLRVIKDGVLLPAPFVSLTVNSDGERGLLGIAFDPDFARQPVRLRLLHRHVAPDSQPRQPLHSQRRRGGARQRGADPRSREPERSDQPQRRGDSLRHRRQALRGGRRKRQCRQLADARQPSRQDPADQLRTARSRQTTRSSARPPARIARSGRWACATRSRCCPAGHGPDLHQRRGTGRVGGDQRRRGWSQLRLARMRRAQRDQQQYSVLRCVRGSVPRLR